MPVDISQILGALNMLHQSNVSSSQMAERNQQRRAQGIGQVTGLLGAGVGGAMGGLPGAMFGMGVGQSVGQASAGGPPVSATDLAQIGMQAYGMNQQQQRQKSQGELLSGIAGQQKTNIQNAPFAPEGADAYKGPVPTQRTNQLGMLDTLSNPKTMGNLDPMLAGMLLKSAVSPEHFAAGVGENVYTQKPFGGLLNEQPGSGTGTGSTSIPGFSLGQTGRVPLVRGATQDDLKKLGITPGPDDQYTVTEVPTGNGGSVVTHPTLIGKDTPELSVAKAAADRSGLTGDARSTFMRTLMDMNNRAKVERVETTATGGRIPGVAASQNEDTLRNMYNLPKLYDKPTQAGAAGGGAAAEGQASAGGGAGKPRTTIPGAPIQSAYSEKPLDTTEQAGALGAAVGARAMVEARKTLTNSDGTVNSDNLATGILGIPGTEGRAAMTNYETGVNGVLHALYGARITDPEVKRTKASMMLGPMDIVDDQLGGHSAQTKMDTINNLIHLQDTISTRLGARGADVEKIKKEASASADRIIAEGQAKWEASQQETKNAPHFNTEEEANTGVIGLKSGELFIGPDKKPHRKK